MPISLIVFGDKTYTDLHGALSVTPIIFTLTLFNNASRNNPAFWRPLAYIPNLTHGKAKSNKTQPQVKVQDEHRCLALVFKSLCELNKSKAVSGWSSKGNLSQVWCGFISLLDILLEITRGSVIIMVVANWRDHIKIVSATLDGWVILIQSAHTLLWMIRKKQNEGS